MVVLGAKDGDCSKGFGFWKQHMTMENIENFVANRIILVRGANRLECQIVAKDGVLIKKTGLWNYWARIIESYRILWFKI